MGARCGLGALVVFIYMGLTHSDIMVLETSYLASFNSLSNNQGQHNIIFNCMKHQWYFMFVSCPPLGDGHCSYIKTPLVYCSH